MDFPLLLISVINPLIPLNLSLKKKMKIIICLQILDRKKREVEEFPKAYIAVFVFSVICSRKMYVVSGDGSNISTVDKGDADGGTDCRLLEQHWPRRVKARM